MNNLSKLIYTTLICTITVPGLAAPVTPDVNDQQQTAKRQASELEQQIKAPSVTLDTGKTAADELILPQEPDGYLIKEIIVNHAFSKRFVWVQKLADKYAHHRYGGRGLAALAQHLKSKIEEQGYVTTNIIVPEQNLESGVLRLQIVPGYLGEIRFANFKQYGTWRNAFPTNKNLLLNIRDLEQGVEQMQSAGNQNVKLKLVPGKVEHTINSIC